MPEPSPLQIVSSADAPRLSGPKTRAFSLLELMVVVAIVGILASIAGPSVSEIVRRSRAREDLATVAMAFVEARGKAHGNLRCARTTIDGVAKTIR